MLSFASGHISFTSSDGEQEKIKAVIAIAEINRLFIGFISGYGCFSGSVAALSFLVSFLSLLPI